MGLLFLWNFAVQVRYYYLSLPNHAQISNWTLRRPNPNPDGSCFAVDIVDGSTCQTFMTKYDVLEQEIEEWNKQTWR
jgi:hypothetical protein